MLSITKQFFLLLIVGCLAIINGNISTDPPVPCHSNAECNHSKIEKGAFCKDGFCACGNKTLFKNCSIAELAQPDTKNTGNVHRTCKLDQDCHFRGGFCNTTMNQCDCHKDYLVSPNRQFCLQKASYIGFPCTEEKQCTAFLNNTICQKNQCVCINGYHYANDSCYQSIAFGGNCTKTEECSHVKDAVCTENTVCGCPAETVINMDGKRCLPVAREILEECLENVQCSSTFSDSLCIDKRCQCREGYHYETDMSRCFITRGLDHDCGNSYECYQNQDESENVTGKALRCVYGTCTCAENYYRNDDTCLNAGSQFGESALLISVFCILIQSTFMQ